MIKHLFNVFLFHVASKQIRHVPDKNDTSGPKSREWVLRLIFFRLPR